MIEAMSWFIGTMTADITMVGQASCGMSHGARAYEAAERQCDHQDAAKLLIDCLLATTF
jgi:hypothetical protein